MSPRHPASDPQPHHPDPAGVTEHTTSASADPIPDPWPAPHRGTEGPVRAVVAVPGSKSLTNRHLLLAAIADAPMRIRGALDSRDSRLMIDALRALGARIEQEGRDLLITPVPEEPSGQPAVIDAGLAGTIMRFIPPLAAALGRGLVLDGDAAARKRPMGPVLEAVRQLGARVHEDGEAGALPVRIVPGTGPAASELRIDASGSSQFLSGVLLAAALLPGGLTVRHVGEQLPSVPHVRMTVQVLAEYGIDVAHPDPTTWVVPAGRPRAHDAVIEPDLSNAGPFLAAAVVTGDRRILSSVVAGQAALHADFGGVVPEIAARAHAERLDVAVEQALAEAGVTLDDLDAIAVTAGPGLIGGVLAGVMLAKGLAAGTGLPLVGVNHLAGHALTEADAEVLAFLQDALEAARAGDAARLTAMLDRGLPPNIRNTKGDTLLMLAVYHGHAEAAPAAANA